MRSIDLKKYIGVFGITALIFFTALYISDYFNDQRIAEIRSIEERMSVDILSLETQFDLLEELACKDITENTVLSKELNSLALRLNYTEKQLGSNNDEVVRLKRQYSLLQIKDYLLMKKITTKCDLDPVFILYFYSNEGDCSDCIRAGHILSYLREKYPTLRVYAFDYNLDLSALRTLISINEIENTLPVMVIEDEVYYGFTKLEEVESILPPLETKEEKIEDESESTEEI